MVRNRNSSSRLSSTTTQSKSLEEEQSKNSNKNPRDDESSHQGKSTSFSSLLSFMTVGFIGGFVLAASLFVATPEQRRLRSFATTGVTPEPASSLEQIEPGIYPLLRDFQCGHVNLETPRALAPGAQGRGRFVVDVGLGSDGQETLDAVANGFVVFGFEMMAGSMRGIKQEAVKRGMENQLHFVEFEPDDNGKAKPKLLPKPPTQGEQGYAYIFNAGLSDTSGAIETSRGNDPIASLAKKKVWQDWQPSRTPMLTLEEALPEWVENIFFVKIDTQGWEAKVLDGMKGLLQANRIQYVQFEFSPWLMAKAKSGDAFQLLQSLPSMGAICFDMMGEHNKLTRPSRQLHDYFKTLNDGLNGNKHNASVAPEKYKKGGIGPWDDILCWFPAATK